MAQGMVKVQLIGNLTQDAHVRQAGGDSVCGFRIACNVKNRGEDKPEFLNVSIWGKRGEKLAQYLTKGTAVYIDGDLTTRTYEHNGETRTSLEVRGNDLRFTGGRSDSGNRSESRGNEPAQGGGGYPEQYATDEELMPF